MTVVDAGVVITALSDDGDHGRAVRRRLSRDDDLHAPELLDVEVTAALRRLLVIERKLTVQRAEQALRDLMDLPLTRWPHLPLVWRAWRLCQNVRPYDGMYVALTEALGAVLLTGDATLARSPGVRCQVEVLS